MHLIIDIRSPLLSQDPIITRYASNWVDLWHVRHPGDTISYIHFKHQECPENGRSVVVNPPNLLQRHKSLTIKGSNEIFRCINFSSFPPYDKKIITISHIFSHGDILYSRSEKTWMEKIHSIKSKYQAQKHQRIIVPALSIGQETVEILHIPEEDIEIIPYISFTQGNCDRYILSQLSIEGPYWLYDGSYGSEADIQGLLEGYKDYRELGGKHDLIFMGHTSSDALRSVSDHIQNMGLTGLVRIIGALESHSMETLYANARGWIYVGAYYTGGPRIELAKNYGLPLLISRIPTFEAYHSIATTIHPNHLKEIGKSLKELETTKRKDFKKTSNDAIMLGYEKIISEKR